MKKAVLFALLAVSVSGNTAVQASDDKTPTCIPVTSADEMNRVILIVSAEFPEIAVKNIREVIAEAVGKYRKDQAKAEASVTVIRNGVCMPPD